MKKVMFIIISMMICVCGYSQKHMKFQGIEIDGSMKEFVDQLTKKGYRLEGQTDNGTLLSGMFTSKKAAITVSTNSSDNVIGITVALPENTEWKALVSEYNYYKDLYTQKYGMPVTVNEKDRSFIDSNPFKMHQLEEGRIVWECWFETEEGEILLSIKGIKHDFADPTGRISIMYRDKVNYKKNQNKDIEEI